MRETLLLAARGFAIGCADLVPGVSGGTVALVTGIYRRLLGVLANGASVAGRLVRGDRSGAARAWRLIEWRLAIAVGAGAVVAVVSLSRVVEDLLQDQPVRTSAAFFGLIAGAVVVAWRLIRAPGMLHLTVAGAVGVASFLLFGLRRSAIQDPDWHVFLAAGALGICALILPGVSGAFLLLAIGMYQNALRALNDLDLVSLASFILGAALGLVAFSRALAWLLDRYHDLVVATMVGLMLGSLRILWPWPNGLGDEHGAGATLLGAPGPDVAVPVSLATASALLVLAINALAERSTASGQ